MPTNHSQKVLAAVYDVTPLVPAEAVGAGRRAPVFIVASPRSHSGKTFLARLLTDFLRLDGGDVQAFDLNPGDGTLADDRPAVTTRSDLDTTEDQVALFDRLVVNDGIAKVVDVGHATFERFFGLAEEIGFIEEARRHSVELLLLYAVSPHPKSANAYRKLQQRFPGLVVVPVFNEAILKGQKVREQYPVMRAAAVPLQIATLPPDLKAHADNSASFELRSWTRRAFLEFRELELRLLLEKVRASLARPR